VSSGVSQLDQLLGGLFIGDNVVWHDDGGSLASVFCMNFIRASQEQGRPVVYVSFDRSPRNLLEGLGTLSEYPDLTIMDCFTLGKGQGAGVFLQFYQEQDPHLPCRIIRVDEPSRMEQFMDSLYGVQRGLEGDVRIVFESLTGMQELWGGEEHILHFYSHSCPRLYELNTIAYWVLEKRAHSSRVKARINQVAQVAIELSVRRGTTSLTVLKADKRNTDAMNRPVKYWNRDLNVGFDMEKGTTEMTGLGPRLKEFRTRRGFSQTELAHMVGVTPSTISQVEGNLIYPSLPALLRMAEALSVEVSSFFQDRTRPVNRVVFPSQRATHIRFEDVPEDSVAASLLTPLEMEPKAEPYLVEIPPGKSLPSHFFIHKGDEMGYVLTGELRLTVQNAVYTARSGDVVYLRSEIPSKWENSGSESARLLWIKVR